MLIKKNRFKKLGFILPLFIVFSFFWTINAQSDSTQKFIDSEGGTVYAGYDSYLIIEAGALESKVKIKVNSYDSALATDPEAIVAALESSLFLLNEQCNYIDGLPSKYEDDPEKWENGEWAKKGPKNNIRNKCQNVCKKAGAALDSHNSGDGSQALNRAFEALRALDELDKRIRSLVDNGDKKMGDTACANIQDYSDRIRPFFDIVGSLYHRTLVFEFSPHGTEFLIPAELVIPFEEILISDNLFLYSDGDADTTPVELNYEVDSVNETYHFFIEHFSEYYYLRR